MLNDIIYQLHNSNLGDHWTSYGLMTVLGARHRTRYRLGTLNMGGDYTQRLAEIDQLFQANEHRPILVRAEGQEKVDAWMNWVYPAIPVDSHLRWNFYDIGKTVCYQFDGISSAADKNPDKVLEFQIRMFFKEQGFRTIRLGGHLTLIEATRHLSQCSLFVGCDSGFSHMAHSVGCPTLIYRGNLPFDHVHRFKQYQSFRGMAELEDRVRHWLELLKL